MIHTAHTAHTQLQKKWGRTETWLWPQKYCREDQRSCDGRGGGQGTSYLIASVVQWKEKTLDVGGPSSIYFIYIFGGRIRNSEAATSRRGAQRPVWRVNEPEKTGARSPRARTRGQNPLVKYTYSHREGGEWGRVEPERRLEGQEFTKLGRKIPSFLNVSPVNKLW